MRRRRNDRWSQRSAAGRRAVDEDCGTVLGGTARRHVPVDRNHLDPAADVAPKVGRHADGSPDNGNVEREHGDERHRRVSSELDVVKRHVHEPVVRHRLTSEKTLVVLVEVDRPTVQASSEWVSYGQWWVKCGQSWVRWIVQNTCTLATTMTTVTATHRSLARCGVHSVSAFSGIQTAMNRSALTTSMTGLLNHVYHRALQSTVEFRSPVDYLLVQGLLPLSCQNRSALTMTISQALRCSATSSMNMRPRQVTADPCSHSTPEISRIHVLNALTNNTIVSTTASTSK